MEISSIVIIVYCNKSRSSVQLSRKSVLAVRQYQLAVSTVGELGRTLASLAQCCDQLCK